MITNNYLLIFVILILLVRMCKQKPKSVIEPKVEKFMTRQNVVERIETAKRRLMMQLKDMTRKTQEQFIADLEFETNKVKETIKTAAQKIKNAPKNVYNSSKSMAQDLKDIVDTQFEVIGAAYDVNSAKLKKLVFEKSKDIDSQIKKEFEKEATENDIDVDQVLTNVDNQLAKEAEDPEIEVLEYDEPVSELLEIEQTIMPIQQIQMKPIVPINDGDAARFNEEVVGACSKQTSSYAAPDSSTLIMSDLVGLRSHNTIDLTQF